MKCSFAFALLGAAGLTAAVVSGCGSSAPAPLASSIPVPPNATPPAKWLYVDHNGTFYAYALPLQDGAKPVRALPEWPALGLPPAIAVGPYGEVAVASPTAIRIFRPPIRSFAAARAVLEIPLTPAITAVGEDGADLVDMEYDPNDNLWLLNDLGAEISELRAPMSRSMVASLTIAFGQPGSKTAGFTNLGQARFDVNAALYVYASTSTRSRLFKLSFPYAKPPSSLGINVDQADFVDSSQYLPTSRNPATVLLGQYTGWLHSPRPGSPASPPVDVLGQFAEPLQPTLGLFPNEHVDTVVGAIAADAPRQLFYALDATDGKLESYGLPMLGGERPKLSLPCLAGAGNCDEREHLFLAP